MSAQDLAKMLDVHVDGVRHYLHMQIGKPPSKDLVSAPEIALDNLHREVKAAILEEAPAQDAPVWVLHRQPKDCIADHEYSVWYQPHDEDKSRPVILANVMAADRDKLQALVDAANSDCRSPAENTRPPVYQYSQQQLEIGVRYIDFEPVLDTETEIRQLGEAISRMGPISFDIDLQRDIIASRAEIARLTAQVEGLNAAIRRIDAINDHPGRFNVEIDEVCRPFSSTNSQPEVKP